MSGAIVDGTVRRPAGPWTPAVHALLRHYERVGFDGAPRALGVEDGDEVVSLVAGDVVGDGWAPTGDDTVFAVGKLLRAAHDAQHGFERPPDARWQSLPGALPGDEVICHNDPLGPNWVFRGERPVALVDWELAAPGRRAVDVAAAASWWTPLRPDADVRYGLPVDRRVERLRLLLDGYGLEAGERASFLETTAEVWRSWREAYRVWGGVERRERWAGAFDTGRCELIDRNLAWLEERRHELAEALT